MAFEHDEEFFTPRNISYLDLYLYVRHSGEFACEFPELKKETELKINSFSEDELLGLPKLEYRIIYKALHEMGMDMKREVEEMQCLHKPTVLSLLKTKTEPTIYGTCYFGFERRDKEWKEEKLKVQGYV